MKPIVEKILASGLIDKHLTKLLEVWGYLPDGSTEKVAEDVLKTATRERLLHLAEELAEELDPDAPIKETPYHLLSGQATYVNLMCNLSHRVFGMLAVEVPAVLSRAGKYFFKIEDVKEEWLVPGYWLRETAAPPHEAQRIIAYSLLYKDQTPVAVEVSTATVLNNEMD